MKTLKQLNCSHWRTEARKRNDKYGQNFQVYCPSCELSSSWHTCIQNADTGFDQQVADKYQPATNPQCVTGSDIKPSN